MTADREPRDRPAGDAGAGSDASVADQVTAEGPIEGETGAEGETAEGADALEAGAAEGGADDPGDDPAAGAPDAAPVAPEAPASTYRVLVGCLLAWAVPGGGHLALGRFSRGAILGIVVLALFCGGIALEGQVYRPEPGRPLTYLAAIGAAGVGAPYVLAHSAGFGRGDVRAPHFEYGSTFTLVAGLLNLLVVFDAYDVAVGRR